MRQLTPLESALHSLSNALQKAWGQSRRGDDCTAAIRDAIVAAGEVKVLAREEDG